jgi:cell wall-associated NlpC family hydrolase
MGDGSYAALIAEAESMLGLPYVFGAKGPNAYDCSGFVCAALTRSGVKSIQTNAQGLYNACTPVSAADARPGDLIFFHSTYSTSNTVTHVAIYTGGSAMLHAGKPIQYASFDTRYWREHFYSFGRVSG